MRQAILTKYLGPTDHRGARVKAWAYAGSVTISWDDALNVNENHEKAARALAAKFGWGRFNHTGHAGGLPDGTGNAYVFEDGAPIVFNSEKNGGDR